LHINLYRRRYGQSFQVHNLRRTLEFRRMARVSWIPISATCTTALIPPNTTCTNALLLLISSLQTNFSAILVLSVVAVLSCNAYVQGSKTASLLSAHEGLSIRGGQTKMALTSEIPELRAPKSMYANVVEVGAMKASQSPIQTFILGILSGCHIAFGKRITVKLDLLTFFSTKRLTE
jgi:hypothetical protein